MLLHYLVKVETPKMHMNTNSATKWPLNTLKYIDSFSE